MGHHCAEEWSLLQSKRRSGNIDVIVHFVLFKGSNCGVADAVMVNSFYMYVVVDG